MIRPVSSLLRLALLCAAVVFPFVSVRADEAKPSTAIPVPTQAQIDAIAAWLPEKATGVGAPISDRAAWAEASQLPAFRKALEDASAFAKEPVPTLTQEAFDDFAKTGRRDTYEEPFRKRTTRLIAFVVAEGVRNDGRYLPLVEAELAAILAEPSWDVPAHLGGTPAGGPGGAIDLAAAARAWTVAQADWFLGDKLKPATRQAIRDELRRRVFDGYEASVRSGRASWSWMTSDINWNAVCTSGVVGAALTVIDSPKERALFVQAALDAMPRYLSGFADDGYCREGVDYWAYGFGCYLTLGETLYRETGGRINLFAGEKLRNIALYRSRLAIAPNLFPAFGDVRPRGFTPPTALLGLINQRWDLGWTGPDVDPARSDMFAAHPLGDRLFGYALFGFPVASYGGKAPGSPTPDGAKDDPLRSYFAQSGALVSRAPSADGKPALGLAVKAGRNGLPHGHNDNGSYVVALDGIPLILDPGREQYTNLTFGPRRFESMMMNSYGHDVPYVGGTLQKSGPEALAKVVATRFTDEADEIELDLTTSYPVPALKRLRRTYRIDRTRRSVEIVEDVAFDKPTDYGTALVTLSEWKEEGPGVFTIREGKTALRATVTVEGGDAVALIDKAEPVTAFSLPQGIAPVRLGVNTAKPVTRLTLKTTIAPIESN